LSAEELQARPVTFGVVLMLGLALFSVITYVFAEVRGLSKELKEHQVRQLEKAAEIQKVLGGLEARLSLESAPARTTANRGAFVPSVRSLVASPIEPAVETAPEPGSPNVARDPANGSRDPSKSGTISDGRSEPVIVWPPTASGPR
jgi:hypothetical protein